MVPGIIMFSLFGLIGQVVFNRVDAKHSASESVGLDNASHAESIGRRLATSRWTPVKVLSDEEYESMLRERLLRVNAEIAIIDEDIERLRNMPDSVEAAGIHGTKRP